MKRSAIRKAMKLIAQKAIYAPWTDEQVAALNRWQACDWVHPFTCVEHSQHALVATVDGWVCLWCGYTQNWAHDFMTQPPPEHPLKKMRKE